MTRRQPTKKKSRQALTPTDERALVFIRSFALRTGTPPTRQEIADGLKLPNMMSAQRTVQRLKEHGRIAYGAQSKRSIELLDGPADQSELVELPLLGLVAAGRPIEAIESSDRIHVPKNMVRGSAPHFVLRVQGNSMIDDHICDGDLVVIREQVNANNGDKIVALIDGEATLKRFYQKKGSVELHPANSSMKAIVIEAHQHLRIAGVFTGLIRVEK